MLMSLGYHASDLSGWYMPPLLQLFDAISGMHSKGKKSPAWQLHNIVFFIFDVFYKW